MKKGNCGGGKYHLHPSTERLILVALTISCRRKA